MAHSNETTRLEQGGITGHPITAWPPKLCPSTALGHTMCPANHPRLTKAPICQSNAGDANNGAFPSPHVAVADDGCNGMSKGLLFVAPLIIQHAPKSRQFFPVPLCSQWLGWGTGWVAAVPKACA